MADARPIQPGERIPALDIIRGVALLGIFIMNMPGFNTSPFAGADGSHLFIGWWDRGTEQLRTLLFDGKFNSMFSFLFAVGFTLQMERLRQRDPTGANRIYLRRLLCLLAFGLIHAFVFWWGDVLHIYAVLGIFLIYGFSRLGDRWIYACIAFFLSASTVYWAIRSPGLTPEYFAAQIAEAKTWEAATNQAFGHGSFLDAARVTSRMMVYSYTDADSLPGMVFFFFQMCTTMLLGLLAGRHRWIQNCSAHLPVIRRILKWSIVIGLATGSVMVVAQQMRDPMSISILDFVGGICYRLCRVSLMVFYISGILLLIQRPQWLKRFGGFAIAGRMPLTNYLMQTAMGLFIFYGWGLGFWGQAGPLASLVLAVVLYFVVQVPLSRWWLSRRKYGPMEYVWRVATYGRGVAVESPQTATAES